MATVQGILFSFPTNHPSKSERMQLKNRGTQRSSSTASLIFSSLLSAYNNRSVALDSRLPQEGEGDTGLYSICCAPCAPRFPTFAAVAPAALSRPHRPAAQERT